jgi:hypothetical protein
MLAHGLYFVYVLVLNMGVNKITGTVTPFQVEYGLIKYVNL